MGAGPRVGKVRLTDSPRDGIGGDRIRPAKSQERISVISMEGRVASHSQFCAKSCVGTHTSDSGRINQLLPCKLFHRVRVPAYSTEGVRRKC